jgi:hypothetical protein
MKKVMLLASAVGVFAALAIPASAAADSWAVGGTVLQPGEVIEQPYEGFLQFNTGATGTFGCDVTAVIKTNGPHAAEITTFTPTTSTCVGTVAFKGCKVIKDTNNLSWDINNLTTPLVVTKPAGKITFHYEFEKNSCAAKHVTSHLEFNEINLAVEGTNPITNFTVSGKSTTGIPLGGNLKVEEPMVLGIAS